VALRSVVVEAPPTPPPSRRTVVLRAGAPAPKGRFVDILVGILGAILLIAAVALAVVLPDKTYVNPQFRVAFAEFDGEGPGTMETPEALTNAAPVYEFKLDIAEDNVKSVSIEVGFTDDIKYSLPDIVKVDLFAPNGTRMGGIDALQNPPPKSGKNSTDPPQVFPAYQQANFHGWADQQEKIVTGLTHDEQVEQVQARYEKDPKYFVSTHGTWTVRVELVAAQGCPADPTAPDQFDGQFGYCRFGHPQDDGYPNSNTGASQSGTDAGNIVRLFNFRYTYYIINVQELK
jgi:hypothetical protein